MTNESVCKGKKLLYFEDIQDKVEALKLMLTEKMGCELTAAENSQEALEAMNSTRFDLLILDIRIYGETRSLDGKESVDWERYGIYFLKALREGKIAGPTPWNVPVIVITGVVNSSDVEEIGQVGAMSGGKIRYFSKPVRPENVERAVYELLGAERVEKR